MKTLDKFKRGATFALACTWKENGTPAPITGLTITSQLRKQNGDLVDDLRVVADTNDNTKFSLVPTNADTSAWPIGLLFCDIKTLVNGIVRGSETFQIPVIEEVTK